MWSFKWVQFFTNLLSKYTLVLDSGPSALYSLHNGIAGYKSTVLKSNLKYACIPTIYTFRSVHLFPATIFCHVRAPSLPISILLLFLVCAPLHNPFMQCTPHLPHLGQSALTSCTHQHNCLLPCCAYGRCVISLGKQSEVLHLQVSRCCLILWSLQSTHAWLRSAVYCSLKSKQSKGLLTQCINCINSYSSINKEQNLLHL